MGSSCSTENNIQFGIEHDGREYEKKNVSLCVCVCVCVCVCDFAVQKKENIVKQLYFNKIKKNRTEHTFILKAFMTLRMIFF